MITPDIFRSTRRPSQVAQARVIGGAVVIGGASLSGGVGGIAGSLVGALVMAFLANGCTLVGVPNYAQEILVGAIIVAVVALDRSKRGA